MSRGDIHFFEEKEKEAVNVHASNNLIPHPGFQGVFSFDATKGIAEVSDNQKLIWGFDSTIVTLGDVLARVEDEYLDSFLTSIYKKEDMTQSPKTLLKNGNTIQEIFMKNYNRGENGDYEYSSMESMNGVTKIISFDKAA